MSLMNTVLFKLTSYLRCRVIRGENQQPYLERYHLLRLPFGIHIYLHRFVASDPGRALHNHPWRSALSVVLSGEYQETRLGGSNTDFQLETRHIGAGRFNYISGKIYHRINLAPGEQAWTLFIHTASHRSWGFLDTQHRKFSYTDHNQALSTESNPLWWKTALRPHQNPQMRASQQPQV
jgi:hypothetical protein